MTRENSWNWFVAQYKKRGYKSLNQFALANDFQKSSLSRYFHQQRQVPADTIARLCIALKVSPNVLLTVLGHKWQ